MRMSNRFLTSYTLLTTIPYLSKAALTQRTTLATLLRHATSVENRVLNTHKLAAHQVGQAFVADSYASQAKKTLSRYKSLPTTPLKRSASPPGTPTNNSSYRALLPGVALVSFACSRPSPVFLRQFPKGTATNHVEPAHSH